MREIPTSVVFGWFEDVGGVVFLRSAAGESHDLAGLLGMLRGTRPAGVYLTPVGSE